jgi:hypothetical protein
MADSGKNAITSNNGDGSTTDFAIGFLYLDPTHIEVRVGGSLKTLNTDYTITTSGTVISFTAAPAAGSLNIVFTRATPTGTLFVDFTAGASVSDVNLDNAIWQSIYYSQEVEDQI